MVLLDEPPVRLGHDGEQVILVLSEVVSIACVITMVMVGVTLTPVAPFVGDVDSIVKVSEVCVTNGNTKMPSKDGEGLGTQWNVRKTKTNRILIFFHMTIGSILSFD